MKNKFSMATGYLFSVQKNVLSVAVAFVFMQLMPQVRPAQMVQCGFLTT